MSGVSRRGFLKRLGGVAIGVAAAPLILPKPSAPLYIPSERLDFGVPKAVLAAPALDAPEMQTLLEEHATRQRLITDQDAFYRMARTVPVVMLRDEFQVEYGGHLYAGSRVLVDDGAAERWTKVGVAVRA